MDYLYLDNFRGFADTVLPLEKVNFLVGENSTGKTSVLAILSLLSRPDFWIGQNFNTDEYEFGRFKDIVSAASDNKKEFWVGLLEQTDSGETNGFLANFRASAGMPRIYRFAVVSEKATATAIVRPSGIRFRIDSLENVSKGRPQFQERLRRLKHAIESDGRGYRQLPKLVHVRPARATTGILAALLQDLLDEDIGNHEFPGFAYPTLANNSVWISPIRSKPRRTYDWYAGGYSPEGEHIPYVLSRVFGDAQRARAFQEVLERFGETSGLYNEVRIKRFGRQVSAPFEIQVVLSGQPLSLSNVGYGVSQVLPVIVELILGKRDTWFSIQQPEIHLHPQAQAALGDLLFEVSRLEDRRFLIETHSDYLIDRFRLRLRDSSSTESDSQVLFLERDEKGNQVHSLRFQANGEYPDKQPKGFRRFFLDEHVRLLEL